MTTPFSDKPTLVGELAILRPIAVDDLDAIAPILFEDRESAILTGTIHSRDEDLHKWTIEQLREIYAQWATADDRIVWAVVDRASGAVVGETVLNDWDPDNRSCGFRMFLGEAGRNRGIGTEATRLAVGHALGAMGLHRVSLEVYAFNPRARRAYEKAGFVHEGTGRDALLFDGEWVDVDYMAVVAQ